MYPIFIFLFYPLTFKYYNSSHQTSIDVILLFLHFLESLISFLKILEFLELYFLSYEFLKVTYSISFDLQN